MSIMSCGLGREGPHVSTNDSDAALPLSLADDLMEGAEEIAEFLFGDRSKKSVRKVLYLHSEVKVENRAPIFTLGNQKLAARRSRLMRWIIELEEAATGSQGQAYRGRKA